MPGEYIQVTGPLFDVNIKEKFADAVGLGIAELGELGAEILQQTISVAGFIESGSFISSVESEWRHRPGEVGYALVKPTNVWPRGNRPTRSWFEKGTRRPHGKLRKAGGGFAKTKTRLRGASLSGVEQEIAKVLT